MLRRDGGVLRCAGSIEKHQICKFRAALILIALLALFDGFGATTNGARVSRIKVSVVIPRLTRLHQLTGLGDAKLLKSLECSIKGRHYRG